VKADLAQRPANAVEAEWVIKELSAVAEERRCLIVRLDSDLNECLDLLREKERELQRVHATLNGTQCDLIEKEHELQRVHATLKGTQHDLIEKEREIIALSTAARERLNLLCTQAVHFEAMKVQAAQSATIARVSLRLLQASHRTREGSFWQCLMHRSRTVLRR
jgi:hypothetical protein